MPIKFRCPKCRQAYSIASKKAGTSLRCQKCGANMRIPALKPESDNEASPPDDEAVAVPAAVDHQSDVSAAMRNLLDDDDDIGHDEFVDLSKDELPANTSADTSTMNDAVAEPSPSAETAAAEKSSQNSSTSSKTADNAAGKGSAGDKAAGDDDLAAVLAFEQSLKEDEGPASAPMAPLPDELFAEEDDDEEEESWGGGRGGDDEEMDLTPMVDVTFLLLVFFMITASFSIQKTLEVPPPNPDEKGASTSETIKDLEENSVLVHIDSRNIISVDDEPLNDPTRLPDVMRSKGMSEVLITAHENSMHDMLTKVIDAANEIGMQKIRVGLVKGND
ncbi:MAG: biopolymer transporter ExbD [Rhodopirellula sp.]|nr:biopolymer transporter ExbD [Rhodopirellula sp.]